MVGSAAMDAAKNLKPFWHGWLHENLSVRWKTLNMGRSLSCQVVGNGFALPGYRGSGVDWFRVRLRRGTYFVPCEYQGMGKQRERYKGYSCSATVAE